MRLIRQATPEDFAALEPLGREFYAQSRFLQGLDWGRFTKLWTALIGQGTGVILLLEEPGGVAGMLGGVIYPEPYSGALIATEFFWFVRSAARGGGLSLYKAFEQWARRERCTQIRMVHLLDLMPEKLERVYRHLGYEPVETHYVKELTP